MLAYKSCQFGLLHLSGDGTRIVLLPECLHGYDVCWNIGWSHFAQDCIGDVSNFVGSDGLVHDNYWDFSSDRVRKGNCLWIEDRELWHLVQGRFNGWRRQILSSPDDQLLVSTNEVELTLVNNPLVASIKPQRAILFCVEILVF